MASKNHVRLAKLIKFFIGQYGWKHRNTIFIILSIFFSYALLTSDYIHDLVSKFGGYGYIGGFFVGMFYTYALTTLPATVSLFILAENLNPFLLAAIGATGTIFSEYIIYRFVKDTFVKGLEDFPTIRKETRHLIHIVKRSKFLRNFLPLIAGLIVASPLPDELAATLLGAIRFQIKKFLLFTFIFNFIGILIIASAAKIL